MRISLPRAAAEVVYSPESSSAGGGGDALMGWLLARTASGASGHIKRVLDIVRAFGYGCMSRGQRGRTHPVYGPPTRPCCRQEGTAPGGAAQLVLSVGHVPGRHHHLIATGRHRRTHEGNRCVSLCDVEPRKVDMSDSTNLLAAMQAGAAPPLFALLISMCGSHSGHVSGVIPSPDPLLRYTGNSFLFLGDYVDKGIASVEVTAYLLALKALSPEQIWLLRGNHETRQMQSSAPYGFYTQCQKLFGADNTIYEALHRVFDYMPLAATVGVDRACL